MIEPTVTSPSAQRQLGFHQLLVSARKTWLEDALRTAVGTVDSKALREQIVTFAPDDALKVLASSNIRDELVFPTPIVLEAAPTLVGYYRLLLGIPQKSFYAKGTGMGAFKSMEVRGIVSEKQRRMLAEFCRAMGNSLADLIRGISPTVTAQDVRELPLLTLGSYIQGGNNNAIGKQATAGVFLALEAIVKGYVVENNGKAIRLKNASGRIVVLAMASDPDIRIEEEFEGSTTKKVAIEIKGGADRSNAHNRAGEAEKSHQKGKNRGFRDFWTLISKKGLDAGQLRSESPTTNSWFDVGEVLAQKGEDWTEFRNHIVQVVGIPTNQERRVKS